MVLDASALHVVMFAECFFVPAWLLTIGLCIMLVRDYYFPRLGDGGGVALVHGIVFIFGYQHSYNVVFVPFTVMMKWLSILVREVDRWMKN